MGDVGREVRRLREAKGWSQPKLAVEAGVAVSGVSQIENGKRNPNSGTLLKLAKALDVDVADLFPKAQAPLPLEEAAAGLDATDLAGLCGELDAELQRVREAPAEEVKEECIAELLQLLEEAQMALTSAINGQSWSLTELTAHAVERERQRRAQRTPKKAESKAG